MLYVFWTTGLRLHVSKNRRRAGIPKEEELVFETFHQKLLEDPEYRAAYEELQVYLDIGDIVVQRRLELGIRDYRELARRAGVSVKTLEKIECGNAQHVTLEKLVAVLKALDMQLVIHGADSPAEEQAPA